VELLSESSEYLMLLVFSLFRITPELTFSSQGVCHLKLFKLTSLTCVLPSGSVTWAQRHCTHKKPKEHLSFILLKSKSFLRAPLKTSPC